MKIAYQVESNKLMLKDLLLVKSWSSGVPQGSILGFLLFLLCIKGLVIRLVAIDDVGVFFMQMTSSYYFEIFYNFKLHYTL